MTRTVFASLLIVFAAFSRLMPHPANVAPITALALFSAVYLERKYTFIVPLAAMVLSDAVLGFYAGFVWVYAGFAAVGLIGLWLRNHQGAIAGVGASLAGSALFFIVTNFGVWVSNQVSYPHTAAGLAECYTAAIPFFRNTVVGDLVYVGMMFGAFELAKKLVPTLSARTSD